MSGTDTPGDRLVEVYRAHIGEPDRRTDVYLGFALFFAGLGLGLVGLALFVVERGLLAGEVFGVRQVAFAAGALGLPVVLTSVVVLLPADRRALYVAGGGLAVTVAAVAFFVSVYPSNWNYGTPDYSLQGVTVYSAGLVGVLASTAAALVSYHVERVGGPADASGSASGRTGTAATVGEMADDDPDATAERVRRDIDEAMESTEITWGGVEKVETERLRINPDTDLEGAELDQSSARTHRSAGVDDAVSGLRGLQGGQQRTETSSGGVDEQTEALQELRRQQREAAEAEPDGLVDRLKSYVDR